MCRVIALGTVASLFVLAACAVPSLPPDARPGLDPRWVGASSQYRYPPDAGFVGPTAIIVLPPGMLIDRFGQDTGNFFSQRGAKYSARSLPQNCPGRAYTIYRVVLPVLAQVGMVRPWFDQTGGAIQIETDAPASLLAQDGILEKVPPDKLGRRPCS